MTERRCAMTLCVCVAALIAGCLGTGKFVPDKWAPYRLDLHIRCGNVSSPNAKVYLSFVTSGHDDAGVSEGLGFHAKPDRNGHLVFVKSLPVTRRINPGLVIRGIDCRGSGVPAAERNCRGNPERLYKFTLPTNAKDSGTNVTGRFEFIEFCEMNRTEYRGFDVRQVMLRK